LGIGNILLEREQGCNVTVKPLEFFFLGISGQTAQKRVQLSAHSLQPAEMSLSIPSVIFFLNGAWNDIEKICHTFTF